ncbi:MAG: hypothetical protein Q9163_001735 [Psora crenata]
MMATPKPDNARPSALPSRNPLPLSAAQEAEVRQLYYKRVRAHCADEIREFATCATNRTFSATWEELDAAREEYFATADQRRAEREEKERKKAEAERFFREWWDLDEKAKDKSQKKGRMDK